MSPKNLSVIKIPKALKEKLSNKKVIRLYKAFQKDFNIKARLFDQFMTERILPNYCTFFSSYGKICKNDEFYIFPKLGDDICPHCLK